MAYPLERDVGPCLRLLERIVCRLPEAIRALQGEVACFKGGCRNRLRAGLADDADRLKAVRLQVQVDLDESLLVGGG